MLFILEGLVPQHKEEVVNVAVSVHESVDGSYNCRLDFIH